MIAAARLEACYFGVGQGNQWPRLARVLEASAHEHCVDWQILVKRLTAPAFAPTATDSYRDNTYKLDYWNECVQAAPVGTRMLLIDVDTLILRPITDVWSREFDIAYTTRRGRFPLNAGVVFLRVSAYTRAWMLAWRDENRRMLQEPTYHQQWRRKYGGMNQAALGALLAQSVWRHLTFLELPCLEWNCEDSSWRDIDGQTTRILHIKSGLRRAVFANDPGVAWRSLARVWRTAERRYFPVESARAG